MALGPRRGKIICELDVARISCRRSAVADVGHFSRVIIRRKVLACVHSYNLIMAVVSIQAGAQNHRRLSTNQAGFLPYQVKHLVMTHQQSVNLYGRNKMGLLNK